MGITAENIAADFDISRDDMDQFAAESQSRAAKAQAEGWFDEQITPVEVRKGKDTVRFDRDEYIRGDTTSDTLGKLRAAFQKDGAVTAGNSSGINDGSAMLVLASEAMVEQYGLTPLAKIVSYGFGGVPPRIMGMGPVPATKLALAKSGLSISDLEVVESNEAFAAQACAVSKQLGLPSDIVNPNGGAIALGHPVGATGSIIMTKLIHEVRRRSGKYGLATMCIGGGQGISVIIDAAM
jgi:acetyl-CoA C-acetyltransferase